MTLVSKQGGQSLSSPTFLTPIYDPYPSAVERLQWGDMQGRKQEY
jgi:hypothetical protein